MGAKSLRSVPRTGLFSSFSGFSGHQKFAKLPPSGMFFPRRSFQSDARRSTRFVSRAQAEGCHVSSTRSLWRVTNGYVSVWTLHARWSSKHCLQIVSSCDSRHAFTWGARIEVSIFTACDSPGVWRLSRLYGRLPGSRFPPLPLASPLRRFLKNASS